MGGLYLHGEKLQIVWQQMWGHAQNEMRNDVLASYEKSNTQAKVHKDRDDDVMAKEWEEGD